VQYVPMYAIIVNFEAPLILDLRKAIKRGVKGPLLNQYFMG